MRVIKSLGVTAIAATAALALATAPAHAATYKLRTPGNGAGVEYISEKNTFRVWDNTSNDRIRAQVSFSRVNGGYAGTKSHEWKLGSNGQARDFKMPNNFMGGSGKEFTFQICTYKGGNWQKCSSVKRAYS
ncbi:hypothetical protein A6A06_32100 [Streptomyces sp. CB02923]|uniref:hypothetical protein n=1 Tax=Streptomyces sp. CB02923 TaxID=1718985 RepID=UPI00093CF3F4|nr:hypothetical protein [Streptomyces sp. CB02923]OKH97804.1 hypothetical protein A6A06_32100 [Streptomyces sp. CB02923]